jgi:DNA repair photolyase
MNEEVKKILNEAAEADLDGVAEEVKLQPEQKKRGTNQKKVEEPVKKRVKVDEENKAEKP